MGTSNALIDQFIPDQLGLAIKTVIQYFTEGGIKASVSPKECGTTLKVPAIKATSNALIDQFVKRGARCATSL